MNGCDIVEPVLLSDKPLLFADHIFDHDRIGHIKYDIPIADNRQLVLDISVDPKYCFNLRLAPIYLFTILVHLFCILISAVDVAEKFLLLF